MDVVESSHVRRLLPKGDTGRSFFEVDQVGRSETSFTTQTQLFRFARETKIGLRNISVGNDRLHSRVVDLKVKLLKEQRQR